MKFLYLLILLVAGAILSCTKSPPPNIDYQIHSVDLVLSIDSEEIAVSNLNNIYLNRKEVKHFSKACIPFNKESIVISVEDLDIGNNYFASLSTGIYWDQEIPPPEADFTDVMDLPKKNDPWENKIYWLISIAVIVIYNILQKIRRTSKSWTILGMFYRFFNGMVKDKAVNGGNLEIKRE